MERSERLTANADEVDGAMSDSQDLQEDRRAALDRIAADRRVSRHSPFAIAKTRRHFDGEESPAAPASDPQMMIRKLWGAATERAVNWSRIRASVAYPSDIGRLAGRVMGESCEYS
jgi:hypothetical protein